MDHGVACHGSPDKLPTPDTRESGVVGAHTVLGFATVLRRNDQKTVRKAGSVR